MSPIFLSPNMPVQDRSERLLSENRSCNNEDLQLCAARRPMYRLCVKSRDVLLYLCLRSKCDSDFTSTGRANITKLSNVTNDRSGNVGNSDRTKTKAKC